MKNLINDVIKRLGDATQPTSENRLYQYVDIDWGQVDYYESWPPPVKFPAALIDIASTQPSDEGRHLQMDIVTVQVRVVDLMVSNSSYRAPADMRTAAFRPFDIIWATNRLLHGWSGGRHYGSLTRGGFQKVNRRDGLREYRLTYRVQLNDSSGATVYPTASARPVVKLMVNGNG